MKPISIFVLAAVALAVATPSEIEDVTPEKKVVVHAVPSQVTVNGVPAGAVPIPVSEVLKEVMKVADEEETPMTAEDREDIVGDEKTLSKRWWKEEETPAHGWTAPLGGWFPSLFGGHAPTTEAPAPAPSLSGPFAFQLGAYYNPLIPAPVESPPAYPRYPPAPRPAYNPPATYSPSPSYSSPSSYAPAAPAPYTPPASPSYSPSYSAPAAPAYSPPASYSSSSYPAPSSYSSSSYSPPASSYPAPSSYSPPASYSAPSSSYSPPASSYSSPSYNPPASYSPPSSSYSAPY